MAVLLSNLALTLSSRETSHGFKAIFLEIQLKASKVNWRSFLLNMLGISKIKKEAKQKMLKFLRLSLAKDCCLKLNIKFKLFKYFFKCGN